MATKNGYIKRAWNFFKLAENEIEESRKNGNQEIAVDGCGKAYLALDLATKGLFIKKGVNSKKLPKSYRGLLYFLQKYGDKDLKKFLLYTRCITY